MEFSNFQEDITIRQCSKILKTLSEYPKPKIEIKNLYAFLHDKYPDMFDFNISWESNRDFQNFIRLLKLKNFIQLSKGSLYIYLTEEGKHKLDLD